MPKYLQPANRRGGIISQRLLAKTWPFHPFFPEGPHFCSHLLKVKGAVKNVKNAQRLFSYFCSFQPYHLLPDSNWCDSPFKVLPADRRAKYCRYKNCRLFNGWHLHEYELMGGLSTACCKVGKVLYRRHEYNTKEPFKVLYMGGGVTFFTYWEIQKAFPCELVGIGYRMLNPQVNFFCQTFFWGHQL